MLNNFLLKLFNLPTIVKVRFYPIFNRFFFRLKKIHYGNNFNIIGKVCVVGSGKISIGDDFYMTSGNGINPISSNLQGAIFTDNSSAKITIANNVGMSSTRMWIHKGLTIGNNVRIGAGVLIIDTDIHPVDYYNRRYSNKGAESAPITIEDDVWIGAHSIILKGVTIGARSVIGAGSVVTRNIPADCVSAGNPCKVIRLLSK